VNPAPKSTTIPYPTPKMSTNKPSAKSTRSDHRERTRRPHTRITRPSPRPPKSRRNSTRDRRRSNRRYLQANRLAEPRARRRGRRGGSGGSYAEGMDSTVRPLTGVRRDRQRGDDLDLAGSRKLRVGAGPTRKILDAAEFDDGTFRVKGHGN
jgi:hypothetical protein